MKFLGIHFYTPSQKILEFYTPALFLSGSTTGEVSLFEAPWTLKLWDNLPPLLSLLGTSGFTMHVPGHSEGGCFVEI